MRVVNKNFETITDYDLNLGRLESAMAIKVDATPIDNVEKFAWYEEDWEEVQMYIPNPIISTQDQIADLKRELESTDYKIIKCSECQMLGLEMPYDIAALHAERQAIRDKINVLETE